MSDRVSALLTDGAERPGRARFPIFVQLLATVIGTIAMVLTHLRPDLAATRVEVLSGLLEARFASTGWVKVVALVAGESEDGPIVDRARDLQRHRWAVCAVKALEALAALRDTAREGTDPVPAQVLTSLQDILQQLETDFVGEA